MHTPPPLPSAMQAAGPPLALAAAGLLAAAALLWLLARRRRAHRDLERAHRELKIIHDLTISLQNAPDVSEVQERVLDAVTRELGFRRAILALMDQPYMVLTQWRERALAGRAAEAGNGSGPALDARHAVEPGGGFLAEALLANRTRTLPAGAPLTRDAAFNQGLDLQGGVLVAPLALREHPIGALLVELGGAALTAEDLASLQAVARQAAVAVGTTMLCIDRAQRLAVQGERMRFAREIHDTVAQSLFGIAYALDGLSKQLPGQPDVVKVELDQLRQVAERTRADLRQSILDIWPSTLTARVFESDLRRFVDQFCRPGELALDIEVQGDFAALSPRRQRGLYRVAQEALSNVVQHAGAQHAALRLEVDGARALLTVRDDGRGFDLATALARERNREHFGLKGMQERIAALGGTCEFASRPGHGTVVTAQVPILQQAAELDEAD